MVVGSQTYSRLRYVSKHSMTAETTLARMCKNDTQQVCKESRDSIEEKCVESKASDVEVCEWLVPLDRVNENVLQFMRPIPYQTLK